MKVLGISSSPRRLGNSEILLDRALEGARSAGAVVEKIVLNEINFRPCQECGGCDKGGVCIIHDGMDAIYRKIADTDALILSSPIFFVSLSAQAKMMIDRFQCAWTAKYVLNTVKSPRKRRGIFLSVAGSYRKDHFENARQIIRAFFATLDVEYAGEIFCGGMVKALDIGKDEDAMNKAYAMGKGLIESDE